MKNRHRILPFLLLIFYLFFLRIFNDLPIKIHLLVASIVVAVGVYSNYKLYKDGLINKRKIIVLMIFLILGGGISLYYYSKI